MSTRGTRGGSSVRGGRAGYGQTRESNKGSNQQQRSPIAATADTTGRRYLIMHQQEDETTPGNGDHYFGSRNYAICVSSWVDFAMAKEAMTELARQRVRRLRENPANRVDVTEEMIKSYRSERMGDGFRIRTLDDRVKETIWMAETDIERRVGGIMPR